MDEDRKTNRRRHGHTHASTAETEPDVGLLDGPTVIADAVAPLLRDRMRRGGVVVGRSRLCVHSGSHHGRLLE